MEILNPLDFKSSITRVNGKEIHLLTLDETYFRIRIRSLYIFKDFKFIYANFIKDVKELPKYYIQFKTIQEINSFKITINKSNSGDNYYGQLTNKKLVVYLLEQFQNRTSFDLIQIPHILEKEETNLFELIPIK